MKATITRHALDRVPLSLIIDDSTVLVNLNYFWMRDRNRIDGQSRRWQDVPVVHPEAFTREFAEFCLEHGVRGKFSIVPCPAALGRIDVGLPLFGRQQQADWLAMCRECIVPAFDITPEMLTHTVVVHPETLQPVVPELWEQYDWRALPDDPEHLVAYMRAACRILVEVGLEPVGVTSPGGFGGQTLPLYARTAGDAVREVTGNDVPYFFQRVQSEATEIEDPVWYPDRVAGTAVGEVIASTGDWTGSWTGYGDVDADRYITADLQGGRLPQLIDSSQPAVLISHWQGFYGLHDGDRRGLRALQTVVERLRLRDPRGARTQWRTPSQITRYACARRMAAMTVAGDEIHLDLPVRTAELTLRLEDVEATQVWAEGTPLRRVGERAELVSGAFVQEGGDVLLAFDPADRRCTVRAEVRP